MSVARLMACACRGETRATRASAESPQRWSLARTGEDGWLEATHQLLGDGVFGGDRHRLFLAASAGARLVVRGLAPTALRRGRPSQFATCVRVGDGARLVMLPGALVPHRGSDHVNGLSVSVAANGALLLGSVLTPGRTATGEFGSFNALALSTRVFVAGELAFTEALRLEGRHVTQSFASFGEAEALVSLLAVGEWGPALAPWWARFDAAVAVSPLRAAGVAVRLAAPTLGAALVFLQSVEREARATAADACGPSGQSVAR